ncbi:hypothetical protein ACSLO2_27885, partial [Escherichia coli]
SDIPHLVRASPRHPANASRHAKKFRVPLTVLELVKQKIAGPRDFLFDEFKNGERYAEFFRVP